MLYVTQKPPRPALPVVGTGDRFPVRRVYCVGRNYAAHAREMGHDPNREPPFFFMKPADALLPVPAGETSELPYPPKTANYHFEVEMVVALGQGGRDIPVEAALDYVYGYAVGLDMTRRDLQEEAKQLRRPWELGKAADASGPVGPIYPAAQIGHPARGKSRSALTESRNSRGSRGDDLVCSRAGLLPVELLRNPTGRHGLFGYARGRQRGRARADDGRFDRGHGRD